MQVESHGGRVGRGFVWQLQAVAAGESAELEQVATRSASRPIAAGVSLICRACSLVSQLPGPAATAIQAGKPFALNNPLLLSARIQP